MSVEIRPYSEELVRRFKDERTRLRAVLGNEVPIEHVGASSVGIGGKNIVDILVGANNREQMKELCRVLSTAGYFERHDSHPWRIFMASTPEGETGEGDFHIHICPVNEEEYAQVILLRDHLRKNPDKATEYFRKKKEITKLANYDRKTYKKIKNEYVANLITEAKKKDAENKR